MRRFFGLLFNVNFLYLTLIAAQVAAILILCLCLPALLPSMLSVAAIWALSALTAALLLSRADNGAEVKCAWLTLVVLLPVAGAVICLLSGIKRTPKGVLTLKTYEYMQETPAAPLARAAGALCGTTAAGYEKAEYLSDGGSFFRRMFAEIEGAKRRVYLEFYIVARGRIFNAALTALQAAAARGVEIKILIDGVGSAFKTGKKEMRALKKIAAVKVFHPLVPLPLARQNLRDHRKIVAVDGKVAMTGGVNLADEYANLCSPHGYWKDAGVVVYGEAAKCFEAMFLSMWEGKYEYQPPAAGKKLCLPFCDSPPDAGFCEQAFVQAVNGAKQRVHAMTPYFCVSDRLAGALSFAARRGVDVKILLPHVPDKKTVFALTRAGASALARSGVQFFEYTPGFMHAKCLICDERVFLGSYNLDFRSMRYNYECGILFENDLADDVEQDFQQCLALSSPVREGKLTAAKRLSRFILRLLAPLV